MTCDATAYVSLVVPCYNEQHRLGDTIAVLDTYRQAAKWPVQMVLVDDGSTDRTARLISEQARDRPGVARVSLAKNRGKGAALRAGVRAVTGRYFVFFDADLSYPLDAIERAVSELEGGTQVVIGARDLALAEERYSLLRSFTSAGFNRYVDWLLDLRIADTQCGFKAFSSPVGRQLFASTVVDRFGFDVELLSVAKAWGLKLHRMPIRMTHKAGSTVRLGRDSVRMALDVLRVRRRHERGLYPRPHLLKEAQ